MWHIRIGGVKHGFYTMSLQNSISFEKGWKKDIEMEKRVKRRGEYEVKTKNWEIDIKRARKL